MPPETVASRELLERFARSHDAECFAERAVLEGVPAEASLQGRDAIARLLRRLFYESFADARLAVRSVGLDERRGIGVIEWSFSGRQIAPVFDIAPPGRELTLPISAVCDLGPDGITRSHLYVDAAVTAASWRAGMRATLLDTSARAGVADIRVVQTIREGERVEG